MSQVNSNGAMSDRKKCQNIVFERTPRAGRLRFFHQTCSREWGILLSFVGHLVRVDWIETGAVIKDFVFRVGQSWADNSAAVNPTASKPTSKVAGCHSPSIDTTLVEIHAEIKRVHNFVQTAGRFCKLTTLKCWVSVSRPIFGYLRRVRSCMFRFVRFGKGGKGGGGYFWCVLQGLLRIYYLK